MDGTEAEQRKIGNWPWWLLVVGGVAVAFAVFGGSDSPDADEYPADEARIACEAWVREELKAPSTAEFGGRGAVGSDGDWTITGTVDAENSFGAMLRSTWTCTAKVDGDDWVGSVNLN